MAISISPTARETQAFAKALRFRVQACGRDRRAATPAGAALQGLRSLKGRLPALSLIAL